MQAEDGIRDLTVTGVQTCALPIFEEQAAPEARPPTKASPNEAHLLVARGGKRVAVFARDPRSSVQVWSADYGYPGDGAYLEFHRKKGKGGLRYWRRAGRAQAPQGIDPR